MGILDPKSRVMDVVLTEQGRRALAESRFAIKYFSLSDAGDFYQGDVSSGSSDASSRIHIECSPDMPQDVISLLANDAGHVHGVRSTALTGSVSVYGGQLLQGSYQDLTIVTGSAFASTAGAIMSSSLENYNNNFILGTVDELFDEDEFKLAPGTITFSINENTVPKSQENANISTLESFFQDPLFSHLDNFSYLPPVSKPSDSTKTPQPLGSYASLGGNMSMGFDDVVEEQRLARSSGRLRTVKFDPAPSSNHVHLQFFEQSPDGLLKLDVLDFGTYRGPVGNPIRVLFVGKVYTNDFEAETFVRLFTVTLE